MAYVPEQIPIEAILKKEILNIWKKRVSVGDAVAIHTKTSDKMWEGIVEELDFKECLVGIRTPSGLTYVGLTEVHYVEVLCKKICDKETKPRKADCKEDACENPSLVWTKFRVGDAVWVEVGNDVGGHVDDFEAIVSEINWKYGFVGLTSVSGVTYVPIDSFTAVEKLCAKKPVKECSSSSKSKSKKSGR